MPSSCPRPVRLLHHTPTDEDLVHQLAEGQCEALAPLHDRYATLLCNLAARPLGRSTAEEVVQDVFTTVWQQLLTEKLVAPITSWSDQWYQGIGDGTIASLATGAWMPANFVSGAPSGSGKWRVADLPQWQAGAAASAENGGSSLALMEKSQAKALAYGFVKYATDGDGGQLRVDNGAFPATTAQLKSPAFLGAEFKYFGGQKANEVFAKSAQSVVSGWTYLPFQVYANSIFNDTAGKAYVSSTSLADGLKAWQDQSAKYGTEQGFTVK